MDCSPQGSSVHGILQARTQEWVAMFSRDLPDPGIEPTSPALAGGFFTAEPPRKPFSGLTYVKVHHLMTGVRLKPLLTVLAFGT